MCYTMLQTTIGTLKTSKIYGRKFLIFFDFFIFCDFRQKLFRFLDPFKTHRSVLTRARAEPIPYRGTEEKIWSPIGDQNLNCRKNIFRMKKKDYYYFFLYIFRSTHMCMGLVTRCLYHLFSATKMLANK